MLEVGKFAWSIRLRKQGVLKNKILVVAEGNQSAFMFAFLIMSGVLHQLTMKDRVPDYWQTVGTFLIIGAVVCEYVILVIMLVNGVMGFFRERQALKAMIKD